MNVFKLPNVIAPKFEEFSALELAVLLREVILEVRKRENAAPKVINDFNQKTFDFTHEIELGKELTRVEKADFYEKMEEHFADRRMAKSEYIITDEIFSNLDWNTNKILQSLTPELKKKIAYFKAKSGERTFKKASWDKYYNDVYKRYL